MNEARQIAKEIEDRLKKEADRRNSAYDVFGMDNNKKNVDPLLWRAVELLRGKQ